MCGITGIFSLDAESPINKALLGDMTAILDHRGPDASSTAIIGPVGFGHTRLKVIDLIGGQQPVVDQETGKALIFNGEIYNFRSLQPAGFQSNSDTETLFKIMQFEADDWINRLNGMFAFAAWNNATQELLLVRDRVGIKPLYYTMAGNQFIFGSEIKSLLIHPETRRSVNMSAVPEYLGFRSVPDPTTLFDNIYSLLPGHSLRISLADPTPRIQCWWDGGMNPDAEDRLDLQGTPAEKLEAALGQSIDYRLITDVPVGTYNSGGVDSSLITALVRKRKLDDLHTFSVGFDDDRYDESQYADIVAEKFNTTHHKLLISSEDYSGLLPEAVWYHDTPLTHAHTPQLLALSRLAKEYVTVVLTGEGADETWAGYPRYQIPLLAKRLSWMPDSFRSSLLRGGKLLQMRRIVKLFESTASFDNALIQSNRFAAEQELINLGIPANPDEYRRDLRETILGLGLSDLESVLAFDRRTHMMPLLQRLDRTTMASGVEARVPFLDHRVIEWGMTQPAELKLQLGRKNKILLKKMAEKYFPKDMIYRRKMGFDVPLKDWFRQTGPMRDYLDLITDETFYSREYVDRQGAIKLVDEHLAEKSDNSEAIWGLLNLEIWTRMFVSGELPTPDQKFNDAMKLRPEDRVPNSDYMIA